MHTDNTMYTDNTLEDVLVAIHDRLDEALPEFEFKRTKDGWRSTNTEKLDGRTDGKTRGQVLCSRRKPMLLADHSDRIYLSFWDYIQQRDNLDNSQTFNKLLELAGMEAKPMTAAQREHYRRMERSAEIWELFADYAQSQLLNNERPDSDEYNEIKQYLTDHRKYTLQDIEALNIGWLNKDWHKAIEYIQSKSKYNTDDINNTIRCDRSIIGYSHKLIIPLRNRFGQIEGIAARNINWKPEDKLPKYLYNKGLEKSRLLAGLPHKAKDVLIVEGPLDAGICKAREYAGVVAAIGGKDAAPQQIQLLLAAGVRTVNICLDNEDATIQSKQRLIDLILQLDEDGQIADRVFVVKLPDGIKDVDQLLTTRPDGLDQLNKAVEDAEQHFTWQTERAIEKFNNTEFNDRNTDALLEDVVNIAVKTKTPLHRDALLNYFERILNQYGLPIKRQALDETAKIIKEKDDQRRQEQQLKKLLKTAATKEPAKAVEYIKKEIRSIELRSMRAEYEKLYSNILTEDTIRQRCKDKPKAVQIGYAMPLDEHIEQLEAPAGQLTFFAAKTGHGKTKFLLNVALNILEHHPEKKLHFFTYEIDDLGVVQFALNIFIGDSISVNNRKSLRSYFGEGTTKYISGKQLFEEKKQQFFGNYINSGRLKIHHTEYSADELIGYIEYIRRHDDDAVIIVDYVQKLRSDRKGNIDNRPTELKFVCEDLNACAIRTGLPILMAAQYVRSIDTPLDVAPTRLAEASDIEKISSEIYSVWDCRPPLTGKPDSQVLKAIQSRFGVDFTIQQQPIIILEILKSRLYGAGHYTVLNYHNNSGRITQEKQPAVQTYRKEQFTKN